MDIVINPAGMAGLRAECVRWQHQIADEVARDARRFAPVRTGALKANIYRVGGRVYVSGGEYAAGRRRGTFYWFFNEYGTRRMRAQPFMRPAIFKRR